MAPAHREKIRDIEASGHIRIGAVFRRTRIEDGVKRQRAEARFDGMAGCLRTPGGGSSRQTLLEVRGDEFIRSRLLSSREAARLMGLPNPTFSRPTRQKPTSCAAMAFVFRSSAIWRSICCSRFCAPPPPRSRRPNDGRLKVDFRPIRRLSS